MQRGLVAHSTKAGCMLHHLVTSQSAYQALLDRCQDAQLLSAADGTAGLHTNKACVP